MGREGQGEGKGKGGMGREGEGRGGGGAGREGGWDGTGGGRVGSGGMGGGDKNGEEREREVTGVAGGVRLLGNGSLSPARSQARRVRVSGDHASHANRH